MIPLYRLLLRLLPRDLRERFGADMEADLRARLAEAPGSAARLRVVAGSTADLLTAGAALCAARLRGAAPRMEAVVMTLRHAGRSLAGRPVLTGGAISTLALALALALVAFSVVDGALLRPLPYADGERLAMINGAASSVGEVAEWPVEVPGIEAASTYTLDQAVASTPAGAVEVGILAIGPGFLELLGVPLEEGRWIADGEIGAGTRVVLVARRLWRRLHGEEPVRGQSIELDGESWTVVGIVPDRFVFHRYEREAFRGIGFAPDHGRVAAVARLAPGTSPDLVREALSRGGTDTGRRVSAHLVADALREDLRGPLWILLTAAALVVLIATANVGSLAIARDLERRAELAVRRALGAGRGRIAAQVIAEGLLLSSTAAALALALAPPLRGALLRLAPGFIPPAFALESGAATVGVAALGALCATLVTGVLPGLLAASRRDGHLRSGMVGDPRRAGRWMTGLVVLEAGFATALVAASVLLVATFLELRPTDPGFAVGDRVVAEVRLPDRVYPDEDAVRVWGLELLEAAHGLPGRPGAALVTWLPLSGMSAYLPAGVPGADPDARPVRVHHRAVSAGYREIMEIELLQGRDLLETDDAGAPRVVVLNELAAGALWPDDPTPLGRLVRLDTGGGEAEFRVVGIVADARVLGGTSTSRPEVWTAFRQTPARRFHLLLAQREAAAIGEADLRGLVARLGPNVPVLAVETLASVVGRSMVVPRFQLALLGVLTASGLVLAGVGSFAVLAFRVRRLRRELGIRQAFGASPRALGLAVIGRSLGTALGGAAVGAGVTWLAGGGIGSRLYLYGVEPRDAGPYAIALAVVTVIALLGASAPALGAARADPVAFLRDVDA